MSTANSSTTAPPLSFGLWFRLSLMMFFQYAIWGAWLPLLFPFLAGHRGFTPGQIGDMFAVGALGAILAPWIAGQIADRYFNTERYLAVAHILGGILVFQLAWIDTYWAFLAFSFMYSLIYAPTLSLTNSISFHHLPDRDRDFGRVRVWGTIGWICVGIGVGQWLAYSHTPDDDEPNIGLLVQLLNEESRLDLRETYIVQYEVDGERQTLEGLADPLDFPYLDAMVEGEEPPEKAGILVNVGTRDEPELLAIATDTIVSVQNKLRNFESSLQPDREEFYATVDRTAGREPRESTELTPEPNQEVGGQAGTAAAQEEPEPWIPKLDQAATKITPAEVERREAELKKHEREFAAKVAEEFKDLSNYNVFTVIDRRAQIDNGDLVLLEMTPGNFIERELVDRSPTGFIVRNLESGKLEAVSDIEGIWSAACNVFVGNETTGRPGDTRFVPENSTRIQLLEPLNGNATQLVSTYDIVSIEPYGLFTKAAVDGYIASKQQAGMSDAFIVSAVLGIILGLFCLTLPKTPPQRGEQASATSEALGEIRRQPLLALFLLAVPISCIHQFYFVHASTFLGEYQRQAEGFVQWINSIFGVGGGGLMTIGQMTEIAVLALMPLFAKKYSRKSLLATGIIAYGLRMFLFAYVDMIPLPPLVTLILGVALHGLCFGSFIFVAFMIVDEETTGDVRASAQSLFNLVIVGIGIIVGSKIAGWVAEWAESSGTMNYQQLFSVPMWASVGCLAFLIFFYPRKSKKLAPVETA